MKPLLLQIAVVCVGAMLAMTASARVADETDALLARARQSCRESSGYQDAVAVCGQVIATPKVDWRKKREAYGILIEAHSRQGARQEAIDAAEAMRKAFPKDEEIERRAVLTQVDQYWAWKANTNPEPAVAILKAFAERHPDDPEARGTAWLKISQFLLRAGRYDDALAAGNTALTVDPGNARYCSEVLWQMQAISQAAKRPEERAAFLIRSLAPEYGSLLNDYSAGVRRSALASTLGELKRYDDLRRYLSGWAADTTLPVQRQRWAFALAESWESQDKTTEALAAYRRVFTDYPDSISYWPQAQEKIVDCLTRLGRLDEALKEARVAYEAAIDDGAMDRAASRIVDLFKQIDKGPARAEAFQAMIRYGSAGKDRKAGTADDPKPVLESIAYPDLSARRKALSAVSAELGDGVDASLQRGRVCAYAADLPMALAWYADAFRRCPVSRVGEIGRILLMNGFRPLKGNRERMGVLADYLVNGPAGEDGRVGTADDVADPFASAGLAGPSAGRGGRMLLPEGEAKSLVALTAELRELISRSATPTRQVMACKAYERVVEALVVVDRKETLDWIRETLRHESSEKVQGALVSLGLTVAKSDQLSLVEMRRFMGEMELVFGKDGAPLPHELASVKRTLDHTVGSLEKTGSRK